MPPFIGQRIRQEEMATAVPDRARSARLQNIHPDSQSQQALPLSFPGNDVSVAGGIKILEYPFPLYPQFGTIGYICIKKRLAPWKKAVFHRNFFLVVGCKKKNTFSVNPRLPSVTHSKEGSTQRILPLPDLLSSEENAQGRKQNFYHRDPRQLLHQAGNTKKVRAIQTICPDSRLPSNSHSVSTTCLLYTSKKAKKYVKKICLIARSML